MLDPRDITIKESTSLREGNPTRRVLCFEDGKDTFQTLALLFGKQGYEVISAQTFDEGLELAEECDFAAFLVDGSLPDGYDVEFCRRMKALGSQVPIIFYSANAYPNEVEAALRAGAVAYFVKPVNHAKVVETINQLLGNPKASSTEVS